MSGGGRIVLAQDGPWPYSGATLVRLIKSVKDCALSDTQTLLVEDVMTGERYEVADYYVDMNKFYNEMEVLAWAASQGDRE